MCHSAAAGGSAVPLCPLLSSSLLLSAVTVCCCFVAQQHSSSSNCRVPSAAATATAAWTLDSDVSRQDQSWLLPNWSKGLQRSPDMVIQHHFLNRKALRNARQECSIKRGMHSSRVPRLNDTVQCHSCGSVPAGRNQEWFAGAALEPAAAAEQQPARLQTAAEQDYCTNSESSSEPISRAALEQLLLVQSSGAYTGYII